MSFLDVPVDSSWRFDLSLLWSSSLTVMTRAVQIASFTA